MGAKVVEEFEGCDVCVECLGIVQFTNPGVFNYSLNEDLDAGPGRFISLVVVYASGPGSFCTSMFDARCVIGNIRVINHRTGSWAYKGKAVVMEVLVCVGNESPEILDAIGAVVCDLEEDGRIVDAEDRCWWAVQQWGGRLMWR